MEAYEGTPACGLGLILGLIDSFIEVLRRVHGSERS